MFFLKLKSFIRDYFTLTSRERRGALVLAMIICLQLATIIYLNYLDPPFLPEITTHRLQMDAIDEQLSKTISIQPGNSYPVRADKPVRPIAFKPFDPNTITEAVWMNFGLSQKQARVIRNYIEKGGRFGDKESVAKMYCISPELYRKLEPWIVIAESKKPSISSFEKPTRPDKKVLKIEINAADTIQLAELPLIGPGRARLIFKYRERLGGFVSENQLLEVFTIDSVTFEAILPFIMLDQDKIRKVNFNSDSLAHPYLNRRAVSAILAYRKQHGNFIDINDLRKVAVLDQQMWSKVAPYAVFE